MNDLRTPKGTPFCTPFGQVVLLEVTTYISESSLAMVLKKDNKDDMRSMSIHKVVGYGGLTFEANDNDIIEVINIEDLRYKRFGFATEMGQLRDALLTLRGDLDKVKMSGSVKEIVTSSMNNTNDSINSWKDLVAANRYATSTNYALTQEHNIEFKTDLKTIQKKLHLFFATNNVSVEVLNNMKDYYITDEFIAEYKTINKL